MLNNELETKMDGRETIGKVLALWGFRDDVKVKEEDESCEIEREKHIWTVNNDYILKMTSCEKEMKNNIYTAKLLLREGIPAQRVVSKLNGEDYAVVGNRYYGLFTKLKGEVIKDYFQGDYLKRGFYLGQCVGELHKGLKNITNEEEKAVEYMFYIIELIMVAYFSKGGYTDIADKNIKMINWINSNW